MKLESYEQKIYQLFVQKNFYICGNYNDEEKYKELDSTIKEMFTDSNHNRQTGNRIFYLAVPPKIYIDISEKIFQHCKAQE